MVFNSIKRLIGSDENESEDYIEIDLGQQDKKSKVNIKPFILRKFDDVNDILNSLREGYTIAVVDIQNLRKKDVIELKRAVSKIKKTVEALEGNIAGFGENILIATPPFAQISVPRLSSSQDLTKNPQQTKF